MIIDRRAYTDMYGPTTGDRVRLGDTDLIVEVEQDHTVYGEECKFGGGKVLRDGMGQQSGASQQEALDLVITNALVLDYTGIYKADIGVKDGRIAGIGKAGNPDIMPGVARADDRRRDYRSGGRGEADFDGWGTGRACAFYLSAAS